MDDQTPGIAGRITAYFGSSDPKSDDAVELATDVDYVPGGLLGELDVQQDEVIRRLDELNLKIERLMREWQQTSDDDSASDSEAA